MSKFSTLNRFSLACFGERIGLFLPLFSITLLVVFSISANAQQLERVEISDEDLSVGTGGVAWAEIQNREAPLDFGFFDDDGGTLAFAPLGLLQAKIGSSQSTLMGSVQASAPDGIATIVDVETEALVEGTASADSVNPREGAGYNANNTAFVVTKYKVVAGDNPGATKSKVFIRLNMRGKTSSTCGGGPRVNSSGYIKVDGLQIASFEAFTNPAGNVVFSVNRINPRPSQGYLGGGSAFIGTAIVDVGTIFEVGLSAAHLDLTANAGIPPCGVGDAMLDYRASFRLRATRLKGFVPIGGGGIGPAGRNCIVPLLP